MIDGLSFLRTDWESVLRQDKKLGAFDKKKIDAIESGIITGLQRNLRDDATVLNAKLDKLLKSLADLDSMINLAESAVFLPGKEHETGWLQVVREFFSQTGAKIAVRCSDGRRFTMGMLKDTPPGPELGHVFYKAGQDCGIFSVDSKAGTITGPLFIPETKEPKK